MTLREAFALKQGDYIHSKTKKNSDGSPMRARVTFVKTWKKDPLRIEVHFKRGLYEYGSLTRAADFDDLIFGYGDEPVKQSVQLLTP